MKRISSQTGIAFSYSAETGNIVLNNVNVQFKDANVKTILSSILKGTDIEWVVKDNMIGLYSSRSESSADIPSSSSAPQVERERPFLPQRTTR